MCMCQKRNDRKTATRVLVGVWGAAMQCVELAYDHLKTLPKFPRPIMISLCMFDDLLVISDGSSARWLATAAAAAATMPFSGVTGTWR